MGGQGGGGANLSASWAAKALRLEWSRMMPMLVKHPRSNFLARKRTIVAVADRGARGVGLGSPGSSLRPFAVRDGFSLDVPAGAVYCRAVKLNSAGSSGQGPCEGHVGLCTFCRRARATCAGLYIRGRAAKILTSLFFSSLALFAFWLRSSVVSVLFSLISETALRSRFI